jgi:hypothetical protein
MNLQNTYSISETNLTEEEINTYSFIEQTGKDEVTVNTSNATLTLLKENKTLKQENEQLTELIVENSYQLALMQLGVE